MAGGWGARTSYSSATSTSKLPGCLATSVARTRACHTCARYAAMDGRRYIFWRGQRRSRRGASVWEMRQWQGGNARLPLRSIVFPFGNIMYVLCTRTHRYAKAVCSLVSRSREGLTTRPGSRTREGGEGRGYIEGRGMMQRLVYKRECP